MYNAAKQFYDSLIDEKDKAALLAYLEKRFEARAAYLHTGVVFDVLHNCVLCCVGCGTNAAYSISGQRIICNPSLNQIEKVFRKLSEYATQSGRPIFLNIGGGEPLLRQDIKDILQLASSYIGTENVGIDTNAAYENAEELLEEVMPYVSYIGISVNGLHDYHNWWSGNRRIDAFDRATSTVRSLCRVPAYREKIELTSVATKKNIDELPELLQLCSELNVGKYSVHRAIPVGRMSQHPELIPDAADYLRLLISLIRSPFAANVDFHIHHSIESIHAALLLGIDTYSYDRIGNPDNLSSIGIDPDCNIVFDPWCTDGIWKKMTAGNLLKASRPLNEILHSDDSVFMKAKDYTSQENRCGGCPVCCSGGSRLVAAAHELHERTLDCVTPKDIFNAMQAEDPACPLYQLRQSN